MPRSCRWNCMNEATMSYERAGGSGGPVVIARRLLTVDKPAVKNDHGEPIEVSPRFLHTDCIMPALAAASIAATMYPCERVSWGRPVRRGREATSGIHNEQPDGVPRLPGICG